MRTCSAYPKGTRDMVKAFSLTVSIAAFAMMASTVHAQTVRLKVAHFLPATSNAHANIIQPWCEQLKSESNGRIVCQIYPSLQLGGTPAMLADMARNGVADIVWTAPSYSAGKFPRIEALELPFMLPYGGSAGNRLIWKFHQQYAQEDFRHYKVLAVTGDGGMDLHVRTRPVKTLQDLKGLKLRASSRTAARTLEALGAAPVSMPPAQMTESIAKGVVDGALAAWEVVPPTRLNEVTKYHSSMAEGKPAIGYTVLAMLMNRQKFDRLPADLKEIIDRNSGDALVERFGAEWDKFTRTAKAAANPQSIVPIDDAAYDEMQKAAAPVTDAWVADASKRGVDARALLDAARGLQP